MAATSVKVTGLRELQKAIKAVDRELSREVDKALKQIGQAVADGARMRFSAIDSRSASGFYPRLKGFGHVVVGQRRRSKRTRPTFGGLQMTRALIPSAWDHARDTEQELSNLLDRLTRKQGF